MIRVSPEVEAALAAGRAVVALESTLIAHGLPAPLNLEAARESEEAVRANGAIPATIAVVAGVPTVGLSPEEIRHVASAENVRKASRRDLAVAVAREEWAATTVSATMLLAHRAGVKVFATGGIGGVHQGLPPDVSADLTELARTPVAVVCAGAKSILDLPATLEVLETLGVPVAGYGTGTFPAFYCRSSGLRLTARVDDAGQAAALIRAHWALGGAGVVLAQPVADEVALSDEEMMRALRQAEAGCPSGPARTPYLLARLAAITGGKTLAANRALVMANAGLAARVAVALEEGACGPWR